MNEELKNFYLENMPSGLYKRKNLYNELLIYIKRRNMDNVKLLLSLIIIFETKIDKWIKEIILDVINDKYKNINKTSTEEKKYSQSIIIGKFNEFSKSRSYDKIYKIRNICCNNKCDNDRNNIMNNIIDYTNGKDNEGELTEILVSIYNLYLLNIGKIKFENEYDDFYNYVRHNKYDCNIIYEHLNNIFDLSVDEVRKSICTYNKKYKGKIIFTSSRMKYLCMKYKELLGKEKNMFDTSDLNIKNIENNINNFDFSNIVIDMSFFDV